nr:GntR family transcriptional regulator [Streptomyces sp. SID12501]
MHLRREIADGLWLDRTDFPGERELAERLGISVITSRTALDRLAGEGWIRRQRGRRPQVVHRPERAEARPGPSTLEATGPYRPYTYQVLLAETGTAPAEALTVFGLQPGGDLWQCVRLRSYDGSRHSVAHNVQQPVIGERHTGEQLDHEPMPKLLVGQGHTVARMRRRMGIAHAPAVVTEALGLTIADQMLVATITVHDPDDRVLEWVRIYLHPDYDTPEETMDLTTGNWSAAEPM